MKNKIFVISLGQLAFLLVSTALIIILTFLLGIETGKFLKTGELLVINTQSASKPLVSISLESYSTIIKQQKIENTEQELDKNLSKSEDIKKNENLKEAKIILIQVGAYKDKKSYSNTEKMLKELGMETKVVEGRLNKLFVVVKDGENKAQETLKKLETKGIKGFITKHD